MKARIRNPANASYPSYGGRGIKYDPRWETFPNFIADMGRRPSPEHSLHRVNNDGDYEPSNCVWATRKEQARNLSSTRWLVVGNSKRSLAEWAELYGIGGRTLGRRLDRNGWDVLESLTLPVTSDHQFVNRMRKSGEIVSCL
jgi:hypothetical protein